AELKEILLTSKALSRRQNNGYKPEALAQHFEVLDRYFASEPLTWDPEQLRVLCAANLQAESTDKKRGTDPGLEDPFFISCRDLLATSRDIATQFRIRALREATEFARAQIDAQKQRSRTLSFADQLTRLYD